MRGWAPQQHRPTPAVIRKTLFLFDAGLGLVGSVVGTPRVRHQVHLQERFQLISASWCIIAFPKGAGL